VVGSELLRDGRSETNGPRIGDALAREGFEPVLRLVVGDDRAAISAAIRGALSAADLVVVSGGLGPTFDDLTREGVADALGLALRRDPGLESALRERYRRRGVRMPEAVGRMAEILEGAEVLPNSVGSAPGQLLAGPPAVALVPGVPSEMEAMLESEILPRARRMEPGPAPERRLFKIAGLWESQVEDKIAPVIDRRDRLDATILAAPGDVTLILRAPPERRDALEGAAGELRRLLGDAVYSEADEGIEAAVGRLLNEARLTLSTAESCTGGLLGGAITSVPGSSSYYVGGFVAYADPVKENALGVPDATIRRFGAVSAETALAMARGVRGRLGSDLSISLTGIAGPAGGRPDKPVGLVYVGLAAPWGEAAHETRLPGDRRGIRLRAVRAALNILRLGLLRRASGGGS
jgi:nicotinamide-nucleotide amidase